MPSVTRSGTMERFVPHAESPWRRRRRKSRHYGFVPAAFMRRAGPRREIEGGWESRLFYGSAFAVFSGFSTQKGLAGDFVM